MQLLSKARGVGSGVTDSCKPPDVGGGNPAQLLTLELSLELQLVLKIDKHSFAVLEEVV